MIVSNLRNVWNRSSRIHFAAGNMYQISDKHILKETK